MASSLFALLLGLALLPYSLFGLLFGIGVFGFVPFGTAWIYLRSGREALATANIHGSRWGPVWSGAMVFLGMAALFQLAFASTYHLALEALTTTDTHPNSSSLTIIRTWDTLFGHQHLISAFERTQDATRRQAIANTYHTLTGRNLEEDLAASD